MDKGRLRTLESHVPVLIVMASFSREFIQGWMMTKSVCRSNWSGWEAIRMEILQILQRIPPYQPDKVALSLALRNGHFEAAKTLHQNYPTHYFADSGCENCPFSLVLERSACEWKRLDIQVARWVRYDFAWEDQRMRRACFQRMAQIAAAEAKLVLMNSPTMAVDAEFDLTLEPEYSTRQLRVATCM